MIAKIKICGLTRLCDIEAVNEAKPDYIGFVFVQHRLQVTYEQAAELREKLSPDIAPVGVFVNETADNILKFAESGTIDIIQLHGGESEEFIKNLKSRTDKPVIKAVSVAKAGDVQKWVQSCADYLLLDSKGGGTGKTFDWNLIGEVNKPFLLAGGLNIDNIKSALEFKPFAVDISSGVETDGLKDKDKIISIIKSIRSIRNG